MPLQSVLAGVALALAGRAVLARSLRAKFEADVRRLNAGDHSGLLNAYSDDAVLRFNVGEHRFSGAWVGRDEIERFLRNLTASGLQGEIKAMAMSGPPWAMTLWARFDDHADASDGERLYANQTAIVLKTRWGKVVEHEDFWVDTAAIARLEKELVARGVVPVAKDG